MTLTRPLAGRAGGYQPGPARPAGSAGHRAALLLAGGVLAGSGVGALFKGAVSTVLGIAPPGARGETLAGLFLAAYLGLAVPVVALGVATELLSARTAVSGFAAVLAAAIALVGLPLLRRSAAAVHSG